MSDFVRECLGADYRTAAAPDGREGLRAARRLRPEVVISDVMMPTMGGEELLRELRRQDGLAATPVILLTARADDELRVKLLRAGAADYLLKPFSAEELCARVATLVQARRAARAAAAHQAMLLENLYDAVLGLDAGLAVTAWNGAAERAFGWRREEAVGRPVEELFPSRVDGEWSWSEVAHQADGGRVMREVRRRTRSGEAVEVESTAVALRGPGGGITGYVVVSHDVSDRRRAEDELRASREELRALAARLDAVREEEQGRIALDLHDEMGQLLTGLKLDLHFIEHRLGERPSEADPGALLDRAVAASELVDRAAAAVRRIAAELRPGVLDRLGLGAALRQEARRFQERSGVTCELPDGDPPVGGDAAMALYRIAQEALTNVARHAAATRVRIVLEAQGPDVVLRVEDDGRGIGAAPPRRPRGLGLVGMRERAARLGGEVRIGPGARGGTVVTARVPAGGARPATAHGRAPEGTPPRETPAATSDPE